MMSKKMAALMGAVVGGAAAVFWPHQVLGGLLLAAQHLELLPWQ